MDREGKRFKELKYILSIRGSSREFSPPEPDLEVVEGPF